MASPTSPSAGFSENANWDLLQQLQSALDEFQSPQCSTARRQEIETNLGHFRDAVPGADVTAVEILTMAMTPSQMQQQSILSVPAAHFLCSVLIQRGSSLARWEVLSETQGLATMEQRQTHLSKIRQLLLHAYSQQYDPNTNSSVLLLFKTLASQLTVAYARIAKCIWGNDSLVSVKWDMVGDACQQAVAVADQSSAQLSYANLCGCSVLATLCEELGSSMSDSLSKRRRTALYKQLLPQTLPTMVESLSRAMSMALVSLQQRQGQNMAIVMDIQVLREGLRAMDAILNFSKSSQLRTLNISSVMSVDLVKTTLSVIELVLSSRQIPDRMEVGAAALGCITEIVSQQCWPSGGGGDVYVMEIATRTMTLLQQKCQMLGQQQDNSNDDSSFHLQWIHFLDAFCQHQFMRASSLSSAVVASQTTPPFDISAFLHLLKQYTFVLPPESSLVAQCLEGPWTRIGQHFLLMVDQQEQQQHQSNPATSRGGMSTMFGTTLFSMVLGDLVKFNLFSHNAKWLDEMELEFVNVASLISGSGSGAGILVDNDEEDIALGTSGASSPRPGTSSSGSGGSMIQSQVEGLLKSSDMGEMLQETCSFVSMISNLSPMCSKAVFDVATKELGQLLPSLSSALTTLSSSDESQREQAERYIWDISACFNILNQVNALSIGGQAYVEQHVQLCSTVASCCENLLAAAATSSSAMPDSASWLFYSSCQFWAALLVKNLTFVRSSSASAQVWNAWTKDASIRVLEFCGNFFAQQLPRTKASLQLQSAAMPMALAICGLYKTAVDAHATFCINAPPSLPLMSVEMTTLMEHMETQALKTLQSLWNDESCLSPAFSTDYATLFTILHSICAKLFFPLGCKQSVHSMEGGERRLLSVQGQTLASSLLYPLCGVIANNVS
jgi:hypothetical protein